MARKTVVSDEMSWTVSEATDIEYMIEQPANTVLVHFGIVTTEATVGNANIKIKVGSASDKSDIIAIKNFVSNNVASLGSSIQVGANAKGEAGTALTFRDDGPLHTTSPRTLYARVEISAETTAGAGKVFIECLEI